MLLVTLAGFVPASGGVPSDSFNADRPTFIPQNFMYHAGGRTCAARPYGGPPDVHTTTFHVPCRGTLDIGNNFWEIGSTSVDPSTVPLTAQNLYWEGPVPPNTVYNFTASVPAVSQQSIPDGLTCGDNDVTKGKGKMPLSLLSIDTDSCANAFGNVFLWEQNGYNVDSSFITMEWYIRHCYPNANAAQTWGALNDAWGDTLNYPGMRDSIFNFVLYGLGLRSDDEWFCFGVPLLGVKFIGQTNEPDQRADRAIFLFLMNNPRCADWRRSDSIQEADLLTSQWDLWSDTSHRGEVFDSTVPTLQQLGLDTLLKINAQAGVTFALPTPPIINNASITENPFDNSTAIALSVGRESYITIAVYNVLGQQIAGAGYAGVFEQGSAMVPVNMSNAPPGTYLVRISTANNEVQTLKLTKE